MENFNLNSDKEEKTKVPDGFRGKSSNQMMLALGAVERLTTTGVEVRNLERVLKLPPDKHCVIATSHVTDIDIQIIAYELGNYFDVLLTNQSTQHSPLEDLNSYIGTTIAGQRNFRPIDYKSTTGKILDPQARPKMFNPDNFSEMQKDMADGKTIVIAAHNPSKEFKLENGGLGVVYLAQIDKSVILPTALKLSESGVGNAGLANAAKTIQRRPTGEVLVGEPIVLPPIRGIEHMKEYIDKHRNQEKLTEEEQAEFSWQAEQLRWQSEFLMSKIAELYAESVK